MRPLFLSVLVVSIVEADMYDEAENDELLSIGEFFDRLESPQGKSRWAEPPLATQRQRKYTQSTCRDVLYSIGLFGQIACDDSGRADKEAGSILVSGCRYLCNV